MVTVIQFFEDGEINISNIGTRYFLLPSGLILFCLVLVDRGHWLWLRKGRFATFI